MTKHIREIAEDEHYHTKRLANNVIKLNCTTPETYRKLIKFFKENNIYYHTYQLKEERAYRIVIRYLNHSTDIDELRQELAELGHQVRNRVNARNRITKDPLNLFF
jgi:arsenate reductase-like glutaredoxin family protein